MKALHTKVKKCPFYEDTLALILFYVFLILIITHSFWKLVSKAYITIWTENVNVNQVATVYSSFFIKSVSPTFIFVNHIKNFSTPKAFRWLKFSRLHL